MDKIESNKLVFKYFEFPSIQEFTQLTMYRTTKNYYYYISKNISDNRLYKNSKAVYLSQDYMIFKDLMMI